MEHYKSMYDLDSDKFDDYVRQFPVFKKKIEKVMDEHGWISRETCLWKRCIWGKSILLYRMNIWMFYAMTLNAL